MSSALAIAATTFLLKDLLDNRLIVQELVAQIGEVSVTALSPDRVPVGAEERSQLNIFLYRTTPYAAWRGRAALAARPGDPTPRAGGDAPGPALLLDLHYLISAYGADDFHADILLGAAMQAFHCTPVLITPARGKDATAPASDGESPLRAALAAVEPYPAGAELTITPEYLSSEETSKLWSALQARYRPSATYKVSAIRLAGGEG